MKYDRVSMTWLDDDEWERRTADREERVFQKRANQGELCAPMIITDGMRPVQSQADGRLYDSKSTLRQHYKQAGVVEVGNDVPATRFVHGRAPQRDDYRRKRELAAALGKAHAGVETMSDETIKRRAYERVTKPL